MYHIISYLHGLFFLVCFCSCCYSRTQPRLNDLSIGFTDKIIYCSYLISPLLHGDIQSTKNKYIYIYPSTLFCYQYLLLLFLCDLEDVNVLPTLSIKIYVSSARILTVTKNYCNTNKKLIFVLVGGQFFHFISFILAQLFY